MRLVIASCSVDYSGRLDAHLPRATRVLMLKADGSVLVHSDGGSYKPLNWMSAPARLTVTEPDEEAAADGVREVWEVSAAKTDDRLVIRVFETISDVSHELGVDPGLTKDGVEQLTRYLELLDRDPLLTPVQGVFAAQTIKPQARVLAEDRGIRCVTLDYDAMRGMDDPTSRLF